jgi:thioester reductase-like protein
MRVLVSGVTGQLGHGAVEGDLGPVELVPVVRPLSGRSARDRVSRAFPGRLELADRTVAGDVTQPRWDLDFDRLEGPIDAVLNLAGETDWAAPADRLRATNAEAAVHAWDLARRLAQRQGRRVTLCHVSSVHAAGDAEGTIAERALGPARRTPYEASKWLGETLVLQRAAANPSVRVLVVRMGALVGNSITGATRRRNSLYALVDRGADQVLRLLPARRSGRVDVLPRDRAAAMLVQALAAVHEEDDVRPVVVHACAGEDAPTTETLLAALASVDRYGTWKRPRLVDVPARTVGWCTENFDRLVGPRASSANALIALRYLTFDRIFERTVLRSYAGELPPPLDAEGLARLLLDVSLGAGQAVASGDHALARFSG